LKLKEKKSHWGAAKIREIFIRRYPDIKPPAKSTFHAIFERHGLVKKRKRRGMVLKGHGYPVLRRQTIYGVQTLRGSSRYQAQIREDTVIL